MNYHLRSSSICFEPAVLWENVSRPNALEADAKTYKRNRPSIGLGPLVRPVVIQFLFLSMRQYLFINRVIDIPRSIYFMLHRNAASFSDAEEMHHMGAANNESVVYSSSNGRHGNPCAMGMSK